MTYTPKHHRVRPSRASDVAAIACLVTGVVILVALVMWGLSMAVDSLAAMNWWRTIAAIVGGTALVVVAAWWGVATGDKRHELEQRDAIIAAQRDALDKADRNLRRLHRQLDDAIEPAPESA